MGNIKLLKRTDLVVLLLAIALPWVFFAVFPGELRYFHLEHLVTSYLTAGSAQVASCIFNRRYLPVVYRAGSRHWYETILLVLGAMAIIAVVMKALLLFLMMLIYIVPVITAWYVGMTIAELTKVGRAGDAGI